MQIKALVLVIGGVGAAYGFSMADRGMNYVEVQGKVLTSEVDCFVKNSKGKLVEKESNRTAYMNCDVAPIAAEQFGYSKSDVRKRVKFTYQYTSPVDGSVQKDQAERTSSVEQYRKGASLTVYAHKEKPSKSRLN